MSASTGNTRRTLVGPMVWVTWAVALGWLALAVGSVWSLCRTWGGAVGLGALIGAVSTGWLAWSMRVRYDADGVWLGRRGHTPWAHVHSVEVQPGIIAVPVVGVRVGRGVADVHLDGLAWFGGAQGRARRLAERVAEAGRVPQAPPRGASTQRGRRAL